MIKENDLILQKNKSNSLGNLNLPKIVSNYQNNIQYKTNNPQNSKRKTIKIKLNSRRAKTQRKIDFRTLKTNIELVKSLDIDLKVEQLISREFDSLKLKEKIDQNPDIILKRLGKYKSKQIREENRNDVESKERVKLLEKEFNNDVNEYNIIKNENDKLNEHILNLINIIEDYKLELYALDNYRKEFFQKFLQNEEQKKNEILEKIDKNLYKDKEEYEFLQKELKQFEYDKNLKFQNEMMMKQVNIKDNINRTKELLNDLQEQKKNLKIDGKEIKNKINENKKKINYIISFIIILRIRF